MAKPLRILGTCGALMLGIVTGAMTFAPATAQSSLGMLSKLDRGLWEVTTRGGRSVRSICVRDGSELVQLRHRGAACNRFVVEDAANEKITMYAIMLLKITRIG